jgi:hypothetical protein
VENLHSQNEKTSPQKRLPLRLTFEAASSSAIARSVIANLQVKCSFDWARFISSKTSAAALKNALSGFAPLQVRSKKCITKIWTKGHAEQYPDLSLWSV